MTDNRRQPPPHDDPPARPPTRTDALPTRDADALDAWLDARAVSLREGAAAAPAIPPTGQNGQWSTAIADASTSAGSDVSNRAASLTGVASQFHTRFAAAEEAEAPPAPVDTIWEQIMARSLAAHVATPATPPRPIPQDADRPAVARHPVFARMASHPAATMLLVAAALIAMVLVFRAIDRNTHPPIVDYGPAALVGEGTATPSAAAASDVWLQPITNAECDTPIATPANEHEQAGLSLRAAYACSDVGTKPSNPSQFYSNGFLQRHPEMQSNQYTLTDDDIARAEAISTVIANAHPMITVMGLPGADDQSTRTEGFYEVFLPDRNTIQLDDGRFAIPLTIAFTDEDRATRAATAVAPGGAPPYTVAVYVFTMQDGSPRVDDLLLACIANCDGFWQQQRAMIGTPQAGTDLATPAISPTATADPDAKLPVPSSECIVPTVVANQEALPTRSYVPPLKPTDANAAAVNQAARAFIACIEATPSADNVQDVIAPFETERLRNEMEANADQPPTTEQIEAGKRVSAYLEEQGVKTFAEHAPADAVDPIQTPTPRSVGGWTVTPAGFYSVPMPGVTIQFPDGRIGVPTLVMVTTDDLWADLQNRAYTSGSLGIFAKVGDTWLLDESIALCIGECDAFWQDAATPSGESQWLQPVSGSECQPVAASAYRDVTRPRDYTIVNVPASDGVGVARQSRARAACAPYAFSERSSSDRQFETQRYRDATDAGAPLTADQIAQAQALSAYYDGTLGYEVIRRAPAGGDASGTRNGFVLDVSGRTMTVLPPVYLPDSAIGLSDGRVAMPMTLLVPDDTSWTIASGLPYQVTTLTIWAYVGETWLIDETLPLCVGDCAAVWTSIASSPPPAPSSDFVAGWIMTSMHEATLTASPIATPVGTPASPPATAALPIDRRTLGA